MTIHDLLRLAIEKNASDLHLTPSHPPMMRIEGELLLIDQQLITVENTQQILTTLLNTQQLDTFKKNLTLDFCYQYHQHRFRTHIYQTYYGVTFAFRVISNIIPSIEQIALPTSIQRLCYLTKGLILITGSTGSGKSTTLASMIQFINQTQKKHIITIEDPIEFIHQNQLSCVHQRELGTHTLSFQDALRAALREDPDMILLGEIRDLESIRLALTAAETGHLVLASLHTSSAAKTIHRLIDVFPGDEKSSVRSLLSESLEAIICQQLMKVEKNIPHRRAIREIMICTPAIRHLIREDKISQLYSVIQTGQNIGMTTFEQEIKKIL